MERHATELAYTNSGRHDLIKAIEPGDFGGVYLVLTLEDSLVGDSLTQVESELVEHELDHEGDAYGTVYRFTPLFAGPDAGDMRPTSNGPVCASGGGFWTCQ